MPSRKDPAGETVVWSSVAGLLTTDVDVPVFDIVNGGPMILVFPTLGVDGADVNTNGLADSPIDETVDGAATRTGGALTINGDESVAGTV